MSGKEAPGDIGTQYCMIFIGSTTLFRLPMVYAGAGPCGGGTFNLGAVSKDYSAGRGGGFGDFTGYRKENGNYYPRFLNSVSTTALPPNLISEITNPNGVTYLKIKGANSMQDYGGEQMSLGISGTPGEGNIGALFNIQNTTYTGFNISMPITSPADETIFDQILSTFTFLDLNDSQTYTCPESGWVDCMPGPDTKPECSPEAMAWYKTNCPNFQGGAY